MNAVNHYDAIVVGAGPAGLTAGIYLSRARLKTLIIDEGVAGGQMVLTHEIANYPGVENISGYQLSNIMKKQAISFGCDIKTNVSISSLELSGEVKELVLKDGSDYSSNAVIFTPGGRSRTLGVPGEDSFKGRGISYCATCDGDFFTDKEIVVVGGGNSALEEAVSLTKYASKVTIIHQFDHFQAFEHAVEEARSNNKIHFIMESTIAAYHGNDKLESVEIKNLKSGKISKFKTDGAFIFIGYVPNTEFLKGKVELNNWGEITVRSDMSTNIEGVYAAGDSTAKRFRQITTAVNDGTIAALATSGYLNELKIKQKQNSLA
jgi:thioredoxin reductase (NADPH)